MDGPRARTREDGPRTGAAPFCAAAALYATAASYGVAASPVDSAPVIAAMWW